MPDINVNKLSEALNTKADIDLNNTGVFSTSEGGVVNLVQSTPSDAKGKEVSSADFSIKQGGLELMDVVFAPLGIDESKNKRRYLNGQVLIQSQFPAFTSAVKSRMATMANAFTTETNWQAEKTNSKLGQCGKFVVDDTAGTIRLPCVVNAQGLTDLALIGGIKAESLPNITGSLYNNQNTYQDIGIDGATTSGAISVVTDSNQRMANSNAPDYKNNILGWNFDASRSSSTYQDNAPVQQEAVQYPYCIVVNTGVDESERPINNYQVNNVYSYGMSQYYKGTMNNNSWLKSAGQWNDGTVYTGMYNWLLEQMNNGVSGFVASTAAYTDYDFVINTANQTFRLPLLNGEEDLPSDSYIDLSISGSGNGSASYTPTKNGWVICKAYETGSASMVVLFKNGTEVNRLHNTAGTAGTVETFVKLGETVNIEYAELYFTHFIPAVGNGTLYYYVGDTLQNAQLINVARIEETLVTKTNKVQAAEASMPSDRYNDLTLGASGTTYTAPANGWFSIQVEVSGNNQFFSSVVSVAVGDYGFVIPIWTGGGSIPVRVIVPCLAGRIFKTNYNCTINSVTEFRFIYAQSEQ